MKCIIPNNMHTSPAATCTAQFYEGGVPGAYLPEPTNGPTEESPRKGRVIVAVVDLAGPPLPRPSDPPPGAVARGIPAGLSAMGGQLPAGPRCRGVEP